MTTQARKQVLQQPPDSEESSPPPKVIGVVSLSIYWRNLIIGLLPAGSGGVVAVFRFGPSVFTYSIDGPKATYLGEGDRHDARFDHLEESGRFLDLKTASNAASYTGLPLSKNMQDYTVHIYPSASMENHYTTKNPGYITALTKNWNSALTFGDTRRCLFGLRPRCRATAAQSLTHGYSIARKCAFVGTDGQRTYQQTGGIECTTGRSQSTSRPSFGTTAQALIRTPLNCIIGLSSLIEESEELNPLQRDSMRMIVASGDLLRAVVDDVLDYSKLTTGNVDVDVKRCNLQQTLGSVVHSVEMRGLATDVTIETYYDCRIPEFVNTDTRRIQQILYNLLGNAVKFSRNGGTVDFGISIAEPGFGPIAYSPPLDDNDDSDEPTRVVIASDKVLRFTVKDYGKGIEREDYPKIFKPFIQTGERVDNENIYGGTGLGLPITVKLIHAFGGSISVESKKGAWTKFTVDLPFMDEIVDPTNLALGLQDVMAILVTNKGAKRHTVLENLRWFNMNCEGYDSMVELRTALETTPGYLSSAHSIILLVQEELFDDSTFELLSQRAPSSLITFGPKFLVDKANGHHRGLTKMLPSALVSSMLASLKPLEKKQVPHCERRLSKISAAYQSLRFLIAEDNLVNQKVLRNILGRLGIDSIVVVDNGRAAVDHEAAEPFDVVLMDMQCSAVGRVLAGELLDARLGSPITHLTNYLHILLVLGQMPVMGGVDACRLINERRGGHPRAKVVFVTAHVQENFREECRQAGAVGYLPKPCTLNGVKECLENLVMTSLMSARSGWIWQERPVSLVYIATVRVALSHSTRDEPDKEWGR
eukprot:scaffold34639_cov206-Amphora_coffeaeformis.AAC.12